MKKGFSRHWKSSKQPRKQRKYKHNAPLHVLHKLMSSHLSKELIKKYGKRSIVIRRGDKVKIVRGQFKKKTGKVEKVDLKKQRVYIEGVQVVSKKGNKSFYPIHPSNLIILELNLSDKLRKAKLEKKNAP
ncbi:MAG: 50S ribosomal protein L24 [Nanoarchaeota archaeon]